MKYFVIITAIMLCVLSTACRTQKSTAVASEVPYVVAKGYFVRNDVRRIPNGKITDARLFKEIFGAAAVMGPDGLPTKIDFEKDYVKREHPETKLIVFTDTPEAVIERDKKRGDGLSFSLDIDKKKQELEAFERAYNMSCLDKKLIHLNGRTPEQIWKEDVYPFIFGAQ